MGWGGVDGWTPVGIGGMNTGMKGVRRIPEKNSLMNEKKKGDMGRKDEGSHQEMRN